VRIILYFYRHSKVQKGLLGQFDSYLKYELKSYVPLDPDLMNVLRASILPNGHQVDRVLHEHILGIADG